MAAAADLMLLDEVSVGLVNYGQIFAWEDVLEHGPEMQARSVYLVLMYISFFARAFVPHHVPVVFLLSSLIYGHRLIAFSIIVVL
jgi:hypothetical protein